MKFKNFTKRISLSVMACILVIIAVDAAMHIWVRFSRQVAPEEALFYFDPVLKARWHRPNSSAILSFRGTAPHRVSFNEYGFRGTRPTLLHKPPGVIRIIILGESSTEDGFVGDGRSWPELLEEHLNVSGGSNRVEVLNLGCAGYSLAASLRNFQVNGLKFKPDMAIVYHGNNDFWKAFMSLPRLHLEETHVDYEARKTTWWSRALCKSILLDQLNRRIYYGNMERNRRFLRSYAAMSEVQKADIDFAGIENEAHHELAQLHALCATNGIRLVVGLQASLMKAKIDEPELLRMWEVIRWSREGKLVRWHVFVDGIRRVKEMQRAYARDEGLLCIDVEAAVPKTVDNFIDHIHSTEKGSEAIAEAMAQGLLKDKTFNEALASSLDAN